MLRLDAGHHTLSCTTCGAPLQRLKSLPVVPPLPQTAVSHQPAPAKLRKRPKAAKPARLSKPPKKRKRRKSLFRKLAEEAFDLVEDIFD